MDLNRQRNIVLRFDMRRAPYCPESSAQRYQTAIEMANWADGLVDIVGLSEHHCTEDGFLSAPLQLAGMMAAGTRKVRISVSALLVPLHDPLRLAEDIALIDLASGGRFSATCGLGYRELEYRSLGIDWENRGRIFDQKLDVLVMALSGKEFTWHGQAMTLEPRPDSPVQALLTVGGNSAAAARRAARFGLLFCPAIDDPTLADVYRATCLEHGVTWGATIYPREPATTFISEDPEQTWKDIGDYLLYDATAYGAWRHPDRRAYAESKATDLDGLRKEGKYRVITPGHAIDIINRTGSLHLAPLTGGTPAEIGWTSLALYKEKVAPALTPAAPTQSL